MRFLRFLNEQQIKIEKVSGATAQWLLSKVTADGSHSQDEIEQALTSQYKYKFVARDDDFKVIAAIAFGVNDVSNSIEIHHIGSKVPGYGTKLVQKAIALGTKLKLPVTAFSYPDSIEFYKKLGFAETKTKNLVKYEI